MKKSFIFLLFVTNIVFAQSYNRVTYNIEIDKNKLSKFMIEKELDVPIQQLMFRMVNGANRSTLILHFKKSKSKCILEELTLGNNIPMAKGVLTFLNTADDIYCNSNEKIYYEKRGSSNYIHLAKIDIVNFDWKLENEIKKVTNLVYRKAKATFIKNNRKYQVQAWYCPSIPVKFGPGFFNGLPGLITEVYVSSDESEFDYNYVLNKLDYDKKMGDISPPLDKYDILTEEESEELFSKINEGYKN